MWAFSADVAQLVERNLAKVEVAGSNPVIRSDGTFLSQEVPGTPRAIGAAVARFPDTEEVTGSIPVSPTSTTMAPSSRQRPGAFVVPGATPGEPGWESRLPMG